MISDKTTAVACRCPNCGRDIQTQVNLFQLSGRTVDKACACKQSKLSISLSKDGKIRLLVPCLACPNPHPYTLSASVFFLRDLFVLPCSFSGMDICYLGERAKVLEALEKSGEELYEMMDGDTEEAFHVANQSVMTKALQVIESLAMSGDIRCHCSENGKNPQITVVIDYDRIMLACKACHAKTTISAKNNLDAKTISRLGSIVLE